MASYFMPTVVNPLVPIVDLPPLEALVLGQMFACERNGDAHYYFAEESVDEMPILDVAEVRAALEASGSVSSELSALVEEELGGLDPSDRYLELDLTMMSWPTIFQDIVKRSPGLTDIVITSSFTCSKMQPDGFGGIVTVITADTILSASTDEMAAKLLDQAQYGEPGCAPGHGVHVLVRLGEEDVRVALGEIITTDPDYASLSERDVTDADIRTACEHIVVTRDFSEERGGAVFAAALLALGAAVGRQSPA